MCYYADRKFCFIEANQSDLLLLSTALLAFAGLFCQSPNHLMNCLLCVILLIFLFTLLSILRIMVLMHVYYEKLLRKYPDVVTVKDVVTLTGYTLTTVHNWCTRGSLKAFQKGLKFCIPKIFLVDFFCSLTFRSITRKSLWHIQTLNDFQRKMKHRK